MTQLTYYDKLCHDLSHLILHNNHYVKVELHIHLTNTTLVTLPSSFEVQAEL
jgi:hypothetical protein